jgi:hypothetical protein
VKGGEFLDELSEYQLLKKFPAPRRKLQQKRHGNWCSAVRSGTPREVVCSPDPVGISCASTRREVHVDDRPRACSENKKKKFKFYGTDL